MAWHLPAHSPPQIFVNVFNPPKKKTNMGNPWLVCRTVQRVPRAWDPLPLFFLCCVFCLCRGWGSSFCFVFGSCRLERCQSKSRRCYAQFTHPCTDSCLQLWLPTWETHDWYQAVHWPSSTGITAFQLAQPAPADISEMEQAALHRMAESIAQMTLCQVIGEEIETAAKLSEKACQKLRGIPEVPPQRITDLDNATRQLHQLSCILDSCTISASYEVSQAQKALLPLLRTEKGSSTSSEEHYANLRELTHEDFHPEH